MEAELNAMPPGRYRQQRRPARQSHRGGRSLALAATATLAFGLPQVAHALLPYMQTSMTPRQQAFWNRSLRNNPQRSCRAANRSCMSSVSPKLQQQDDGDEGKLLSSDAIDESGGGGGEAVAVGAAGLPSSRVGDDSIQEQAERSKWSWGRKKREGEEKKGLFSYDWENGDRIVWKASKKSKAEVVSKTFFRLFSAVFFGCLYGFRSCNIEIKL